MLFCVKDEVVKVISNDVLKLDNIIIGNLIGSFIKV